ncbi:hypothetical protein Dsin_013493 [Dipteronia sinensis]|uniref:RRM domain-containing protein n=1 Tax=Dipteronia sinensis TaxID=43782 RepID=A0AAE0AK29_9ROSI|nr:hypothetical protein Dsin_013493 [Dipteronia sinensis]
MRETVRERGRWPDSLGREESQVDINGWGRRKDFREGLFSIFIDNLNPNMDLLGLWCFFKPFGKVRDVFLASKKSSRRSCFGFIRFETIEEATKVVKMVNDMLVHGLLLRAKLALYGWKSRRLSVYKEDGVHGMEELSMESREEGLGRSHNANFEENKSFVDVMTRNQKCSAGDVADVGEKVIDMSWNSNNNEKEWLSRCAVGTLREFTDVSSVNRRLRSRGFSFSLKYLWDKFILWVFESKFERESFIYNRFFWDDKFSSMVRWSDSINPQNRLAWIDCFGVSRFWNVDFFIQIGWLLGEPLLVEEDTLFKKRFDRGRVLVLIPLNQSCPNKIKVTVGNGSFCVKISEVSSLVDSLASSHNSWLERILVMNLMGDKAGLSVDVLPLSFTEHEVEAKGGLEVGGQLKEKDKSDGDQFSLDSGNDSKMVDRLAVNHNFFKSREEKLVVMALDIGAVGASLSFSESSLEVGLFSNFQLLSGEASNTVDVLIGQEEIVKVLKNGVLCGSSDLLGDRVGERCIRVGGKSCEELVRESEVAPISVKGLVKVLSVASPNNSKRRRERNSLYLRSHSMKTRSSSACEMKLQQKADETKKVVWNLHNEIAKVIVRGLARGFDFNGKRKEMLEIIAMRG